MEEKHTGVNYAFLGNGDGIPTARSGADGITPDLRTRFEEQVPIRPPHVNPFASPALGFDYFISDGFSLGASVSLSGSTEEHQGFKSKYSAYAVQVRGGYAHMFSSLIGVWLQGGATLSSATAQTEVAIYDPNGQPPTQVATGRIVYSFQNLSLAVPFLATPTEYFAIMLGPVVDFGFGGSRTLFVSDGTQQTADATMTNFGAALGVCLSFLVGAERLVGRDAAAPVQGRASALSPKQQSMRRGSAGLHGSPGGSSGRGTWRTDGAAE